MVLLSMCCAVLLMSRALENDDQLEPALQAYYK
jgi:hypothetical protein